MKLVGLTGGIGSGKTTVASVFKALGIPVFNADSEARKLTNTDPGIHAELKTWLGGSFFTDEGLDRSKLAGMVFRNPDALARLNSIIHPRVRDAFLEWSTRQNTPYVIHEAAILIETGFYKWLNHTILVTCPLDIRINRVMERDGTPLEEVLVRINSQMSDEQKIPLASYIILNDGLTPLIPAVLSVHKQLIT